MFGKDKDIFKEVTKILDNMSDDEKAKKAQSLKKLMEEELSRRNQGKMKKPKKD